MADITKINNGSATYNIKDATAARDNAVVHLTGTETIAGYKTFSNTTNHESNVAAKNNYASFVAQSTNISNDLIPETDVIFKPWIATFSDNPNTQRVFAEIARRTDGSTETRFGQHSHLLSNEDDVYNILVLKNNRTTSKRELSWLGERVLGSNFAETGMPGITCIHNVLAFENGATYTAPSNGWLAICAVTTTENGWIRLYGWNGLASESRSYVTNTHISAFIPVRKGTVSTLFCSALTTGSYTYSRFIPCRAEETT